MGEGGLNAAVALRALDVDVSLIGCVGTDALGAVAVATAEQRGVDLSRLQQRSDAPTGTCVLLTTPGGERTLLSHRGANVLLDDPVEVDFDQVRLVLVFGYALLAAPPARVGPRSARLRSRRAGCPTSLDVGLAVAHKSEVVRPLLPSLELLLLNESELLALTGAGDVDAGLAWLHSEGSRNVVIKCGAHGCVVATPGFREHHEGVAVQAVDTTACGDAFAATFSWAWAQGCSAAQCARLANRMGALTASGRGAADSVPCTADWASTGVVEP